MSALDEILTAVKQGKLDNNRLSADQRDVIQQHWDELTTTVFAIWAPYPRPTQDTVLAWEEEGGGTTTRYSPRCGGSWLYYDPVYGYGVVQDATLLHFRNVHKQS
jgi:hypothetical protein